MHYSKAIYNFREINEGKDGNRVSNQSTNVRTRNKSNQPQPDITAQAIGDFGKWQLKMNILMALLKLSSAWFQLNIVFMAPPQDFWCAKPNTFPYSEQEWRDVCAPKIEERPCLIFDPDFLDYLPEMKKTMIPLVPCKHFVYDKTVFKRTIISDWDLVCFDHWYIHLTQCVVMSGVLLGSLIFGKIADTYGRKLSLMAAIVIQSVLCFVASLIPGYSLFLSIWFIVSLAVGGISLISFVMCLESVSGEYRTTMPIIHQLPFFFGNVIVAGLAYYLRDWRKLDIALAFLSSFYITYWFLIPESPRWLLATGRTDEAYEVLKEIAAYNKMPIPRFGIIPRNKNKEIIKGPGFMDFLRSKKMRPKTLLLSVVWFCSGVSFYTFSQYLGGFGGNIFITISVTGIISCFGGLLCVCTITRMGRKKTVGVYQLLTGTCFVLILLIPEGSGWSGEWPRLICAGVGFAGMAGSIPALYLFSGEIFPTLGRNVGVGGVTMFARIGSMIAPLLLSCRMFTLDLPLILLAIMSFAQNLLLLPLPDTKNRPLPETLEEAELI